MKKFSSQNLVSQRADNSEVQHNSNRRRGHGHSGNRHGKTEDRKGIKFSRKNAKIIKKFQTQKRQKRVQIVMKFCIVCALLLFLAIGMTATYICDVYLFSTNEDDSPSQKKMT